MSYRSKTIATWLALIAGSLGAHRFYLHGKADLWAWLHPWPTLLGLAGVLRMRNLGQDDQLAWLLIPVFGLMISQAMLAAIVIGLTPDEQWQARFNPGQPARPSGWATVIAVVAALLLGGAVLMGTIAFGGQKFFEWQAERDRSADQNSDKLTQ
ncbi:TM2 domain-containing protein [Aquincola sp. S2]|uniref:TM2 domain-containing protein n=1 Tax=Pseudaquabacterium terrae TaxID=2732868 RepID=A0ABX2EH38_9BURK|nr:TM2 domain-containing protein [Aquabacterium terrae]NRF67899.1 TM2 domain-containing protein [Aquabacterium terrae]